MHIELREVRISLNLLQFTFPQAPDAPAYLSTCADINGELLAIGGCDKVDKPLHLPFTSTTQQLTPGISSATRQLLNGIVLLQSSQPMR